MSFEQDYNKELYHYGVKGMKWGVRKAISSGNLTNRQIKKYAKKQYAKDSLNSNRTTAGRVYDRVTGAHKINADIKYGNTSKKQNKEAAQKYLTSRNKSIKQKVAKGAASSAKVLGNIGTAYISDQVFTGGMGTAAAKAVIKGIGRATITAYTMARGGYDIRWYDK